MRPNIDKIKTHFYMKNVFTALFLVFGGAVALAQTYVSLHISPTMTGIPFEMNTSVAHPSGDYNMAFSRFDYYISEVKIIHDGGQVTVVDPSLHFLVHAATDSVFSLGPHNVTAIEGVTFSVGVDATYNHTDPASYPSSNPLSPQSPDMNWGWASGYRFAAVEGMAGNNLAQMFQIHALGDGIYKTVTIMTEAEPGISVLVIHLSADYAKALTGIDVSSGLIEHSETGAAANLMKNMKDNVFSAWGTVGVVNPSFEGSFGVSPNPVLGTVPMVRFSLPSGNSYRVSVSDMTGRALYNSTLSADSQSLILDQLPKSGVFFVQLWQNGHAVASEKLVIIE